MENPAIIAKGSNGQVEAYEDKVVITRKGFFGVAAQGFKGDRTFYYSDLKGIEYRKPTMMANGYIQFITNFEMAENRKTTMTGQTAAGALHDSNTVTLRAFKKENVKEYEKLHEYVMERFEAAKSNNQSQNSPLSSADEITKFKGLLDNGVITQEEFDAKKKQLLGL